ncbi:MAG: PH domain-containing protein [Candidatus Peribacteraceae bacterium]|jgi:hypothetical protein|nr:hypothetical protein [bacterium]MDP6561599.1 PH domain-containing protein [Candidatus Peribacteraceae bacterium]|tara:strand:- start:18238 stop:18753 length:516 start_codon:yes stop_codon:yes gene_type:complete
MNIEGFHSQADEKLVMALSTHWMKYVLPTVIFTIVMGASVVLLIFTRFLSTEIQFISGLSLFASTILIYLLHHWYFHRLLSEAMEDIIITTKRVIWIEESLYVCDNMRQIPLDKIQGVEAEKHGIFQTVLGYGTLWFDTGGTVTTDTNAIMKLVPHPHRIAKEINQLLRMK